MPIDLRPLVTPKRLAFCGFGALVLLQPIRPVMFLGKSMSPTYHDREVVLTMPIVGPVQRGDVVIIATPTGRIVKRVAFVGGDRIWQICNAGRWQDLGGFSVPQFASRRPDRYRQIALPKDVIYVMGDNRGASMDSRHFGPVPLERVERKVISPRPMSLPTDLNGSGWMAQRTR